MDNSPWIEKYRPKTLDKLIQDEHNYKLFRNNIIEGKMPHYLLYGPPGTGKTSAIHVIGRELFDNYYRDRVIEFNASNDRGINEVREKITTEARRSCDSVKAANGRMIPPFKIIILDEFDFMTDEAQDALRVVIEQYSTVVRFCFICNYITNVTEPIKSRCAKIYFRRLDNSQIKPRLLSIASEEKMELNEELENCIDNILTISNGDMRKAIMLLQMLKYKISFKKLFNVKIKDLSHAKTKVINALMYSEANIIKSEAKINEKDIYDMAASITLTEANEIIEKILNASSVKKLIELRNELIAIGYPIDVTINQINRAIMESPKFDDRKRAIIFDYAGKILFRMKECANEKIQLLDYLQSIYSVRK